MKRLSYKTQVLEHKIKFKVTYKEKPPKFILDIIARASKTGRNVSNWLLEEKGFYETDMLFGVVEDAFADYAELFSEENEGKAVAQMNSIIANGFLVREELVGAQFNTLEPLIASYELVIDGKSMAVSSREGAARSAMSNIISKTPNGFEFNVEEYYFSPEPKTKSQDVEFILNGGELTLYGQKINMDALDFAKLLETNELFNFKSERINPNVISQIDKQWEFFGANEYRLSEWDKCEINNIQYFFKIKSLNVEILELAEFHNLPVVKEESLMQHDFNKENKMYDVFFRLFVEGKIQPNKFMFLTFLRNEREVITKLISETKSLQKLVNDKEVLVKILLLEGEFSMKPFNLNKTLVEEIIVSASIPQIPTILKKLSTSFRDTLISTKVLTKLSSVSFDLLSPKQLKIVKDEQERKRLEKEEFEACIGKITVSGLREGIKTLSHQRKIELGAADKNNSVKKFLDKYIGHSSVGMEITPQIINEAKRIAKIAEKYVKSAIDN